ncbi:aminoglycoside phosphotransferase (APT) family kinase protein [Rhizobium sp. BK529]|uniref:phosphotransferase family protein n=1 Tax=unclassified Rhizobium TaxID=2613769 RepID=UPI00104A20E1|nr:MULTISPECIES: aminoglycoside phosphotransferase family protein [unclassified Rhizobium]MBB3590445.1 aminoglycoside phosphotransferase (APT) family kinase protein [Rhizobium sp. BK529]TCS05135.1 Ser/Thr protein kinase RdoA (MazF antagonist) [Rhizobium sp. BK418]
MSEIGRLLGAGKEAEVYEHGTLALKLYRPGRPKAPAFREAANLAIVERLSLPAPRIHVVGDYHGRWGLLMDRATGSSLADEMTPEPPLTAIKEMAALHLRLHREPGTGLPSLKSRLSANIESAEVLSSDLRDRLLLTLAALPDDNCVCHGDFHPWNILGSGQDTVIVDWLDACSGNPAADVCRTYLLMRRVLPAIAEAYVVTYAKAAELTSDEIFTWLPVIAAARLAENVPEENEDLLHLAALAPACG